MIRKFLPKKKWIWGVVASILSLCAAQLILDHTGIGNWQTQTNNGGIHMQSYGVFNASNVLIINNQQPTPTEAKELPASDSDHGSTK